ncbi:BatA domain-containing protein [Luteimonas terricola]|uniref:Membrane protein n=1 Tax=Luteimonas terricola TaxID=645597 RepID=A0ABQ2EBJ2_9GAMM|nr:BatA domain-containing protein [Luteimonas terricola]GGK05290.1 membrane protein [Luteimonas terricola]
MIPALLLPAGLAALAALLLPLLLHLARREERRPVDFAALRWLSTRLRPRRSVRFEEWLLLALRLLLVALLALLLARPVLYGTDDDRPWIVAVPGLAPAALLEATRPDAGGSAATTVNPGVEAEWRWLVPGFPAADPASPSAPSPSTAHAISSLLRQLDMRMPAGAALTVLVPPVLEGVDAERPRLSRAVDWRVVEAPAIPTTDAPAPHATHDPAQAPRLTIRHAPDRAASARYLRAAALAWNAGAAGGVDASSDEAAVDLAAIDKDSGLLPPASDTDVLAWLAPGEVPPAVLAWVESGGTALLSHDATLQGLEGAVAHWRDPDGHALLQGAVLGHGRALQWTRPLRPDAVPALLEADFPHRLRAVLVPPAPPSRVVAAEHAPLVGAVGPWPQGARELSPWLALLIALLFVIERWIAAGPRRERVA